MSAVGLKIAAAAGASLLLLMPAFNSLNQVTVSDVRPPLTLNDPPPNIPPPDMDGDMDVDVEAEEGPRPTSPDCPPPSIEPATPRMTWTFPALPGRSEEGFVVEPGALGIGVNYNVEQFVGHLIIGLVDPSDQTIVVHEYSSVNSNSPEDPERVGNAENVTYEIRGAVPGEWRLFMYIGAPEEQQGGLVLPLGGNPATGRADAQAFKAFPCGGAGRPAAASARGGLDHG